MTGNKYLWVPLPREPPSGERRTAAQPGIHSVSRTLNAATAAKAVPEAVRYRGKACLCLLRQRLQERCKLRWYRV